MHVARQNDEFGSCCFDRRLNPGFLLRLRIFRDRKIMIGDVLEPGLDGERLLGMVRDDRDDVHADLADAACIEQMAKAVVALGDEYDHLAAWRSIPNTPVNPEPESEDTQRQLENPTQ